MKEKSYAAVMVKLLDRETGTEKGMMLYPATHVELIECPYDEEQMKRGAVRGIQAFAVDAAGEWVDTAVTITG